MNVAEGARRIRAVGRILGMTGAAFALVFLLLLLAVYVDMVHMDSFSGSVLAVTIGLSAISLLGGGWMWVLGWIVAGVGKPMDGHELPAANWASRSLDD